MSQIQAFSNLLRKVCSLASILFPRDIQLKTQLSVEVIQKTIAAALLGGNFTTQPITSFHNELSVEPTIFILQINSIRLESIIHQALQDETLKWDHDGGFQGSAGETQDSNHSSWGHALNWSLLFNLYQHQSSTEQSAVMDRFSTRSFWDFWHTKQSRMESVVENGEVWDAGHLSVLLQIPWEHLDQHGNICHGLCQLQSCCQ